MNDIEVIESRLRKAEARVKELEKQRDEAKALREQLDECIRRRDEWYLRHEQVQQQLEQANAACAKMQGVLHLAKQMTREGYHANPYGGLEHTHFDLHAAINDALSTDCGNGWLSPDEAKQLRDTIRTLHGTIAGLRVGFGVLWIRRLAEAEAGLEHDYVAGLKQRLAEADSKLAEYTAALERDRKPDWERWLMQLADFCELTANLGCAPGTVRLIEAARQLRYMATDFTLKANFVQYNLAIRQWWWRLYFTTRSDEVRTDMETFMREHNIPLEKPINV